MSVVYGELQRAPEDRHAILNPTILVEVLSPSTEEYDCGEKLRHYQAIPSLQLVLLVAHDTQRVTVVRRTSSDWERSPVVESVDLPGGGKLVLTELYGPGEG